MPIIEILTFGMMRSSGRVRERRSDTAQLILYVHTDKDDVQPFADVRSVWVRSDGYWWSTIFAGDPSVRLQAWVVAKRPRIHRGL